MPSRDIFTRNNIEKAAAAIRREQARDNQADRRVRAAMLRQGLNEEDLDLRYRLQDRALADLGYGDDAIDPDDLTETELRQYATPEEFSSEIPFRGFEIDPDDESYTGYRLANQNPEVLELMRQQRSSLGSDAKTAAQNRLFEDIRAGRVDTRDLQTISGLQGASTLLSDEAGDAEAYEAASFIEQQRTGNPEARIDLDLDETVESSLEEASRFINRPMQAARNVAGAERLLGANLNAARGAVARSRSVLADELSQRINRLEREGLSLLDAQTLQGAEQNSNRLREIVRSLNAIEREASVDAASPSARSSTDERTAIRNRILPQVEEALGERGVTRAVNAILRDQDAERNRIAQEQRLAAQALRSGPISDQLETLDTQFRQPMSPRLVDDLATTNQGVSQSPLPGLWELVEVARQETNEIRRQEERAERARLAEEARKNLYPIMNEYPEVLRVLQAEPKSQARTRARGGESSKALSQYMDFTQQYASPEARAAAYDATLEQFPAETRSQIAGQLQRIESDYTSGNTRLQRDAVAQLEALGGDLSGSETPAAKRLRPVIGGGRYVTPEDIEQDPELRKLVERIDTRAEKVNKVLSNLDLQTQRDVFPNQYGMGRLPTAELALNYDESTGRVTPGDFADPNAFRVKVNAAARGFNPRVLNTSNLFPQSSRTQGVSVNALRFFADNPVLRDSSVSFEVAPPGQDFDYVSKGPLPGPVADVFTSFVQQEALKGVKPGTIVSNSPVESSDLLRERLDLGETEATSSTLRKLMPFKREGQVLPNLRGVAYQSAGFSPTDIDKAQYTFISPEGEAIPVQLKPSEVGLKGKVKIDPDGAYVSQGALPASSPRYFSTVMPGLDQATLSRVAGNIRRAPASLLPGAADLIPSAEAVRRGYEEGPQALAEQVGRDFISGLPVGAASAVVLSAPALAPIAPAVGLAALTYAGGEAANEVIRQETGEGFVPKLRQFLGTEERTGIADRGKVREERPFVQPRIVANTQQRNPLLQSISNRIGLARERFNPAKGEFGLSELLFDR